MPHYAYKAVDAAGRTLRGRMEAQNLLDLEARLQRSGLDLIDARPARPDTGTALTRRDLIALCFHLEQLMQAGVPIIDALADLRDSAEIPRLRTVLAAVLESVSGGATLSGALAAHPRSFDAIFVGLVRAGENAGTLPAILRKLGETLKWQDELAAQTRRLLVYPLFLFGTVGLVALFMLLYLVPRMVGFLGNLGQELPAHTRFLLGVSRFLADYPHIVFGLPLLLCAAAVLTLRHSSRARDRFDLLRLDLPWIGPIHRKIVLARFAAVFAMMYAAGIAVLDAVRATQGAVGNRAIEAALAQVERAIGEGQGIAAAFAAAGLFPPLVVRMLRVGENTGRLDDALAHVGYFYDRDVRESIARMQAAIEPVATVALGLLLGWLMLAVLGPIYDTIAGLAY